MGGVDSVVDKVSHHTGEREDRGCTQGSKRPRTTINWNEWNPFVRATGEALRQLNKRKKKASGAPDIEEALL